MASKKDMSRTKANARSSISAVFVENNLFLKSFLARFFSEQQDIEDVAQEAYLRAYVAEQEKEIEQPKAFLFRIAKNVALTKLTQKSKQITDYIAETSASLVIETTASAEEESEAREHLGLYCEAVADLPDKCRQAFLLCKVHGLAHKEIAERMDLTVSSVEKYLRKAIRSCKSYIDEHEGRSVRRLSSKRPQSSSREVW